MSEDTNEPKKSFEASRDILASVPPLDTAETIRGWWHEILRNYGRYPCYAIVLCLPSDKEIFRYLTDFNKELDLISGNNCLVIALTKIGFRHFGYNKKMILFAIEEHFIEGYSLQIAQALNIELNEFPCLILFRDIRTPDYISINIKDMTAEEIAQVMRSTFSIIQKAISQNANPLTAIAINQNHQKFLNNGKTIVSKLRNLTGKTFEVAVESWIKSLL